MPLTYKDAWEIVETAVRHHRELGEFMDGPRIRGTALLAVQASKRGASKGRILNVITRSLSDQLHAFEVRKFRAHKRALALTWGGETVTVPLFAIKGPLCASHMRTNGGRI